MNGFSEILPIQMVRQGNTRVTCLAAHPETQKAAPEGAAFD
jgi:hypothetical protein